MIFHTCKYCIILNSKSTSEGELTVKLNQYSLLLIYIANRVLFKPAEKYCKQFFIFPLHMSKSNIFLILTSLIHQIFIIYFCVFRNLLQLLLILFFTVELVALCITLFGSSSSLKEFSCEL